MNIKMNRYRSLKTCIKTECVSINISHYFKIDLLGNTWQNGSSKDSCVDTGQMSGM